MESNAEDQATPTPTPMQQLQDTIMQAVHRVLDARQEDLEARVSGSAVAQVNELLVGNSLELTEKAAKRVKLDNPDLTNKGNIDQHKSNTEVLLCIERAENSFARQVDIRKG